MAIPISHAAASNDDRKQTVATGVETSSKKAETYLFNDYVIAESMRGSRLMPTPGCQFYQVNNYAIRECIDSVELLPVQR